MAVFPHEKTIIVPPEAQGERLDVFLAAAFPETSRSRIQKIIDSGMVSVNDGIQTKKRLQLNSGDSLRVMDPGTLNPPPLPEPQDIPISVLYQDEHIAAIDKPAGMVVHPGNGNKNGTLVNALLFHIKDLAKGYSAERPGIVHRLDKDTSGVLIVAKTNAALASLSRAFSNRNVRKSYLGICIGVPDGQNGTIEAPLGRSRKNPVKRVTDSEGKDSVTGYHTLVSRCGISIVQFLPHTGRTHQIRVHSSYRNFPILADPLYGGGIDKIRRIPPLERPFAVSVYNCFSRQALHARSISFLHPATGERQTIESPLPADFLKAMALFGPDTAKNVSERCTAEE